MTSSMRAPRSSRALVSPSAQRMASTRLLLPLPLGPTMAVMPGSSSTSLCFANVLNPDITTRRSLIGSILRAARSARQHMVVCTSTDHNRCHSCRGGPAATATTGTPAPAAAVAPAGALAFGDDRFRWRRGVLLAPADDDVGSSAQCLQQAAAGGPRCLRLRAPDRAGAAVTT